MAQAPGAATRPCCEAAAQGMPAWANRERRESERSLHTPTKRVRGNPAAALATWRCAAAPSFNVRAQKWQDAAPRPIYKNKFIIEERSAGEAMQRAAACRTVQCRHCS